MDKQTVYLLLTAAALMLLSGGIFGFLGQWLYAAPLWIGALGCLGSALCAHRR